MAKGRRLTISLSERYQGSYGGGGGDAPELGEEDIWSAVDDMAPPVGGAGDQQGAWTRRAGSGMGGGVGGVILGSAAEVHLLAGNRPSPMAKGRRLTISLSERYLGSYGYGGGSGGHGVGGADAPELGEEDIWSAVDDMAPPAGGAGDQQGAWTPRAGSGIGGGGGLGGVVLGNGRRAGGLSLALVDSEGGAASPRIVHQFRGGNAAAAGGGGPAPSPRGRQLASSAPVNVPDWSKIYRADSVESLHDSDDTFDDGEAAEMVPPHEYLAREYARNRKGAAAPSVFEGVGRTLKGRDMRRIRDAVWSRTGFDG